MKIAFKQTKSAAAATGDSQEVVLDRATTTGNTLIVAVATLDIAIGEITDNKGNSYSQVATKDGICDIWLATNIVGGESHTVTVTLEADGSKAVIVQEFENISRKGPFDKKVSGLNNTTTTVLTAYTPQSTQNEELIFAAVNANSAGSGATKTITLGDSSYSNFATVTQDNNETLAVASKVSDSTDRFACTFIISALPDVSAYALATFRADDGVGVTTYMDRSRREDLL